MDYLENILQAWWHSETLSPKEVPTNGTISNQFTMKKIKKIQKIYQQNTVLPNEWINLSFTKTDMQKKFGLYGQL